MTILDNVGRAIYAITGGVDIACSSWGQTDLAEVCDIHDQARLRVLATQNRSGGRRTDLNLIAVSKTQRMDGRQPAEFSRALGQLEGHSVAVV